ncbi:MAG: hypothetical protein SVM79_06875 [Chloroflexota bacterium]|nr:hypothetical protein [Chloroflexota bacterium]
MARMPKWATPERQAYLVNLFMRSKGFCIYGHKPCTNPDHHYVNFCEDLIHDWIGDDRAERQALWQAEQREMHFLNERGKLGSQFDSVAKEVFYAKQPLYYVEGLGISGLTFKPFAKVRLSSSYTCLHVDISHAVKGISKNRKRKAIRYGKLPYELWNTIDQTCSLAVKHYLT